MSPPLRRIIHTFLGIAILALLGGCAMYDRLFGSGEEEKPPEELMREATEDLNRGSFASASKGFQAVKDRYPYSNFALEAELKMADALYKNKAYDEALDAYDDFEKLHPKNNNIPYVIYQKGMCHFAQVTSIDRDQSHTLKAKGEFERLIKKYPRSEWADRARRKIRQCYVNLAYYELYVGHFYFKKKAYQAAIDRYRYLLEHYPDLGQYHEALEYLHKSREKLLKAGKEKKRSWWQKVVPLD